jgi:hypothetical protein
MSTNSCVYLTRPALEAHDTVLIIVGGFELDVEAEFPDIEFLCDRRIVSGKDRHSAFEHVSLP